MKLLHFIIQNISLFYLFTYLRMFFHHPPNNIPYYMNKCRNQWYWYIYVDILLLKSHHQLLLDIHLYLKHQRISIFEQFQTTFGKSVGISWKVLRRKQVNNCGKFLCILQLIKENLWHECTKQAQKQLFYCFSVSKIMLKVLSIYFVARLSCNQLLCILSVNYMKKIYQLAEFLYFEKNKIFSENCC